VSESVILKWTVPVDDRRHAFEWSYGATVVHVGHVIELPGALA
jgi:hypothetical protein